MAPMAVRSGTILKAKTAHASGRQECHISPDGRAPTTLSKLWAREAVGFGVVLLAKMPHEENTEN